MKPQHNKSPNSKHASNALAFEGVLNLRNISGHESSNGSHQFQEDLDKAWYTVLPVSALHALHDTWRKRRDLLMDVYKTLRSSCPPPETWRMFPNFQIIFLEASREWKLKRGLFQKGPYKNVFGDVRRFGFELNILRN